MFIHMFSILRHGRCCRIFHSVAAMFFSLAASLSVHAADTPSVALVNHSGFDDLQPYVNQVFSDEIKTEIGQRKLAVFAFTVAYPGQRACYAFVGLTHQSAGERAERLPGHRYESFITHSPGEWDSDICRSDALKSTLESMNSSSLAKMLAGVDATLSSAPPERLPADRNTVALYSVNLDDDARQRLFEQLHARSFGQVFDYRQMQSQVLGASTAFKGGRIMCLAIAGVGARTPANRSMRWPSQWQSFVRLQEGGTENGCLGVVAPQALEAVLDEPWSDKGLLRDFAKTRENGVPLPDPQAVNRRLMVLQKAVKTASNPHRQVARTHQSNVVRCTNECVNGRCVRTFEGGRKEVWNAPRKLDQLSGNWGWDTTTNACGL